MKAVFKLNDRLTLELDAESPKGLFEKIAEYSATFEDTECGACKSKALQYTVREVEDNKFYEIHCTKCGCKVSYGHAKDGKKMYPKRGETDAKGKVKKDKDGKGIYLPNNGWVKYVPKEGD